MELVLNAFHPDHIAGLINGVLNSIFMISLWILVCLMPCKLGDIPGRRGLEWLIRLIGAT